MNVSTIDLNFLDRKGDIATYLLPHLGGAVLVDPGPESTLQAVLSALDMHGLASSDVTHVLLTHIHLDHAGAAGWFANQGAQVYVHPVGVPHLLNPEKLIASASRLYGARMNSLWGDIKSVPADHLVEVQDQAEITVGGLHIRGIHTPGHAEHHVSYLCEDIIFSGDAGGIRFERKRYIRLPFVPPETHLEKWRASLKRMLATGCERIAPTHFGIFDDANAHLVMAGQFLDEVELWLERTMPGIQDAETLEVRYADYLQTQGLAAGLDELAINMYDRGDPINFAASGLFRYWQKFRSQT